MQRKGDTKMGNRFGFWAKCSAVGVLILASTVGGENVAAQSGNPSSLPLLGADGVQYLGGFRVPATSTNNEWFSFGGGAMAFNPANNSLFVSNNTDKVAEINIPAPVNSSDPNAMPFASYLQGFADPTEGRLTDVASGGVSVSGLMVYGGRLFGAASIFYDANNSQRITHFSRSLQLNAPSFSGWSSVWQSDHSGYVSGWMSPVPSEWQTVLGGPALTGQCCVPIVWRTSNGPAALSFNPGQVGQSTVTANPLLYYTQDHATLGPWDGSNPTYGATTQIRGMAAIAGTRTLLYIGRNGMGPHCYGNGTANQSLVGTYGVDGALYCYDPTTNDKGSHAYPYRFQIWAYDLNDFAAVKSGAKQPWDVVPYGVWPINFPTFEGSMKIGGVAYDSQRQLLYVAQSIADVADGYLPIIHVFRLNAAPGSVPAATTVSGVTVTADKTAPQQSGTPVTFTAQPTGGVAPYQYKWLVSDGATSSVAANWTASNTFTWTPSTANASYSVSVWVRGAGNASDAAEASMSMPFAISATPTAVTSINLVANKVAPQQAMTAITWTATTTGGIAPVQYKFIVTDGANNAVTGANWSTTNSFVWTPSTANANYHVIAWARSAGSNTDAPEAEASALFAITAAPTAVSSVALSANKPEPQLTGTTITWTAAPSGGTAPYVYKWFVSDGTTYAIAADWSSSATFNWTPSTANASYRVRVWVKGASNPNDQPEASIDKGFAITAPAPVAAPPQTSAPVVPTTPTPVPAVTSVTLVSNKPSPQPAGSVIVFTAQPAGGVGPYQYQWWAFDNDQWSPVSGWTSVNSLSWTRNTSSPKYQVQVRVRSAGSTNDQGEATATIKMVLNNGKG